MGKHANFEETLLDDYALDVMSTNCPDMEYLKISGCCYITQDGLERFVYPAYASNLKCLDMSNDYKMNFISDDGLRLSHFLRKLKQDLPNLKLVTRFDDEDECDGELE